MEKERFEELVDRAVAELPEEFLNAMENVEVMVEDRPNISHLRRSHVPRAHTLLGLYEGIPRTKRSAGYNLVLPDRITIFQRPIEGICSNDEEIVAEVGKVVRHEIAHHFGIGDARLRELEGR